MELRNADASITGAKLVRVKDVLIAPEQLAVDSVEVVDASLHVSRDPVGALLALGFRIPLSVFQKGDGLDVPSSAPEDGSKAQRILGALPDVRVGSVRVTNASLAFRDQAFAPPLETTARLDSSSTASRRARPIRPVTPSRSPSATRPRRSARRGPCA